jgi:hypothetical protein
MIEHRRMMPVHPLADAFQAETGLVHGASSCCTCGFGDGDVRDTKKLIRDFVIWAAEQRKMMAKRLGYVQEFRRGGD